MREIKLYGALAKFVGQRRFLAEVSSAGEAIRMLLANFPGLERHMADQYYKVIVDNYESQLEEINFPASETIKIVPVVGGAGSGVQKIIVGAVLIVAAVVTAGAALSFGVAGFSTTAAAAYATAGFATAAAIAGNIGIALVLGGVAQLLSPTPQLGGLGPVSSGRFKQGTTETTELDPQESYSFSGIQNTSRQGTPVPVVYGETVVGSVVISAGIDVDDI